MQKSRPVGISLLSLLYMIVGVLIVIFGALFAFLGQAVNAQDLEQELGQAFGQMLGGIIGFLGIIFIVFGILIFSLGWGLWKLSYVAWIIAVILHGLSTLSIILNFQMYLDALAAGATSMLLSPIITIVIFVYLIMVREVFK
ncbi:MAG: hypothetical protein ACTSW1_14785 [Candidatus Hodarchaeales archaeon]